MAAQILSHSAPEEGAGDETSGPLQGMKVVIQPNLAVRGWPARAGTRALEGFIAPEDATVVERLRRAGARLVGYSCMSELGLGLDGDTTAGALSEGLADAALMIDALGEARAAAAGAGLFGFKPSWGLVSRYGLNGLVPSMECPAVLAGTLEKLAAVLGAMAGPDERDFSMPEEAPPDFHRLDGSGKPIRVLAVPRQYRDGAGNAPFREALKELQAAGLEVRETDLQDLDILGAAHQVIAAVEASSSCGRYDGVRYGHRAPGAANWNEMYLRSRAESFGPLLKSLLFQGAYFQFADYPAFENACRIRGRFLKTLAGLYESVDGLVLPAPRRCSAAALPRLYEAFACTLPASLAGQPAVTIPGLDLQLMGPRLSDARLLAAAGRLAVPMKGGR